MEIIETPGLSTNSFHEFPHPDDHALYFWQEFGLQPITMSQWELKEKTNCAKRGKTQVTRSHLIGWESGGKFSRPITVGSKVKPLQHRISFDIQLKISPYTDTYELKRINFNDKRILYLFVIREWRRWRSNRPTFLHTLCRGQRIRNGLHLTCHWKDKKVTKNFSAEWF